MNKAYYFIGIGGTGMSALARVLKDSGFEVAGSDRDLQSENVLALRKDGIRIFPQDASSIENFILSCGRDIQVVISSAVEEKVPELIRARNLSLTVKKRAEILSELVSSRKGIAVGGTSGKTTTSAMVSFILEHAGFEPSYAIGAPLVDSGVNGKAGSGDIIVVEADESDSSIVLYEPYISIVTNISREHHEVERLIELFGTFVSRTRADGAVILNGDCKFSQKLSEHAPAKVMTFGVNSNIFKLDNISQKNGCYSFNVNGFAFQLNIPGFFNVWNALAATAAASFLGIPLETSARALRDFHGVKKRFEKIGEANGITVFVDFAHNPDEIEKCIETACLISERFILAYQPHGYGPLAFVLQDLAKAFSKIRKQDHLLITPVYYGGGTVDRKVDERNLFELTQKLGINSTLLSSSDELLSFIPELAKKGDTVLLVGARDISKYSTILLERIGAKNLQ